MTLRALLLSLSVVAGAIGASAQTQAPDPGRMAAAKEMMVASGAVKQFDEAIPLLVGQMARSFMTLVPDKAKEIREVFDQLGPRFLERKGELIDQVAELYAAELSQAELEAVVAFYKSPVGLKFAAAQPRIVRQSVMLGQRWGERIGREVEQQARQELKKRGIDM
jgi:hypothetical protein